MRTFVAIEILNDEVVNAIKEFQTKIHIDAKSVKPNNFHFTLQFLGEISNETSQKIIQALRTVEFSSFNIKLKGIGTFPKSKSPKIIWVGTDEKGRNSLNELFNKVEKALESVGFFSDKPFKPHITIFRIKKKIEGLTSKLDNTESKDFGIQNITSIKLKKSELTPNGPIYTDLEEIKAVR